MRNGNRSSGIVAMGAALAALLLSGPAAAQNPPLSGILGISVTGEPIDDQLIAICAGQVPATCYRNATGLTMDLGTGQAFSTRDFTAAGGQPASFGQNEFFFRGAHPLAVPQAGFLSVAGFSFELTSYQLDYQDVGVHLRRRSGDPPGVRLRPHPRHHAGRGGAVAHPLQDRHLHGPRR